MDETGKDLGEINLKTLTLSKVFELELQNYEDKVMEICIEAKEEAKNEENLQKIDAVWKTTNFVIVEYKKGVELKGHALREVDDIKVTLEDNILILQSLSASKYIRAMKSRVQQWEKDLNTISDTIDTWMVVQRKWMYLEGIFASDDIKLQLPEEAKKFGKTDIAYKKIMESAYKQPNCMQACVKADGGNRLGDLKNISFDLDKCQKSLSNYLESKQMSFPRFYFISNEDLLAILGNSDPKQIQGYMLSLFDNCKKLEWEGEKKMVGMYSDEGEYYDFVNPVKVEGKVEDWMNKIDDEMKASLQTILKTAVFNYAKSDRIEWIKKEIGMIALCGTQIWWTFAVEDVFRRVAGGDKHAMKKELAQENIDLNNLIALVRENISSCLRKCVNTLIILDVHARDIVDKFVRDSILSAKEFAWESVLRFYWDLKKDNCDIRQCTGSFAYCYEYQGLNGRLVITPLTDRCVMTLTTALTFFLGGAPAGPAGTGKTETVKDLAKGLALRCVVTNCGETMDFVACGIIFSGLIQTGFWGCFDEFNRINVEVLSVVSAQIKMI
jgi:dynein heavy chain